MAFHQLVSVPPGFTRERISFQDISGRVDTSSPFEVEIVPGLSARGDPRLLGTLAYAVPVASTLLLVAAGEGALDARVALAALLVAGGGLLAATARG